MIRAVRPTDVVALAAFQAQARATEITAPAWPHVPSERDRLSILWLLAEALFHPAAQRHAWLSLGQGRVDGLTIARARAHGLIWDVERLLADGAAESVPERLLDHLAGRAGASGARRVFFEAPIGQVGMEIARRAGFRRYVSAALYGLVPPFKGDCAHGLPARFRLRADDYPLFQLYNLAVPLAVRAAEAMTYDEWVALHRGRRRWAPSPFGARQQYVWEEGGAPVGWVELSCGRQSQHLSFLVHPNHDAAVERLLHFGMSQASGRVPVYATVRSYEPGLGSALERAGFQRIGESDCYVRHLARRVAEPRLVPAKMVGGF